ncbi:MAG: RluA family pseudouridine synthase [bacterium]
MGEGGAFQIEITSARAGQRADTAVAALLTERLDMNVSRERAKTIITTGLVSQDGKRLKPASKLREGMLEIAASPERIAALIEEFLGSITIEPQDIPLDVIHEDARIIVINKQAGVAVHPSPSDRGPTVAGALLHRYGAPALSIPLEIPRFDAPSPAPHPLETEEQRIEEPDSFFPSGNASEEEEMSESDEPAYLPGRAEFEYDPVEKIKAALSAHCGVGIVHRLDKMTTGCLVVARDVIAHRHISSDFAARSVQKEYLAVVYGAPKEPFGTLDAPIGRHPKERKQFASGDILARAGTKARFARTDYEVLESNDCFSLLRCILHTGRTHQIRVHLKSIGLEIVGDVLYGTGINARFVRAVDTGRKRDIEALPPALSGLVSDNEERIRIRGLLGIEDGYPYGGHLLHAWRLGFIHPDTGVHTVYTAPPPPSFGITRFRFLHPDPDDD